MNVTDIMVSALRTQGHKITKNRTAILEFLSLQDKPISVEEILDYINSDHQKADKLNLTNTRKLVSSGSDKLNLTNKTTIYRELEFLLEQNFIKEIEFGDGKKRYEITINRPHHHHIVCVSCKRVEDIPLGEELELQEKKIEEKTSFKLTAHMLEFFGVCGNCR
ncbi:MAG: Fur family transcriptional regulator [Candidatus Levyibacteriota bacterium]